MTPESRKTFNTYMGALLILLALGCFGLASYMIFTPATEKPAPLPRVSTINKQQCIEGLKNLGFRGSLMGADIRVTDTKPEANPYDRLKDASLGIAMCHLYLKKFCMGPGCQNPEAMSFELTPDDPMLSRKAKPLVAPTGANETPNDLNSSKPAPEGTPLDIPAVPASP
jgi:hypothetical protein